MKVQKGSRIGIVVGDGALRAAQRVDGRTVTATVPIGKELKKSLRQLLSSAPFVGRQVAVGLEGSSVLIESLVVPAGVGKSAKAVCAERLKGDPVFNEGNAVQGVAVAGSPTGSGPSMVIHAAVVKERVGQLMQACRELELSVASVEAAALGAWRAWSGTGPQVRLVRNAGQDIVLAGDDAKLLFCRIVERPISTAELKATITRAATLLAGKEGFPELTTSGVEQAECERLARGLGLEVRLPAEGAADAEALGLASPGPVLTEFTPAEERVLQAKRQLRRARVSVIASIGSLALLAGFVSFREREELSERKSALQQQTLARTQAQAELDRMRLELAQAQAAEESLRQAQPGHKMSRVFELVANASPGNLLMESVAVEDLDAKEAPPLESEAKPGARSLVIRIHGLAESELVVRRFADALLETQAFSDVRVEASERVMLSVGEEAERFRIFARAETR